MKYKPLIWLILFGTATSLLMGWIVLPHYDEYSTFLYFVRFGPVNTLIAYDIPNNHVFFSFLFACFYKILPANEPHLYGRFINILLSPVLIYFFWHLLRRFSFNRATATLVTAFFCFSYPVLYYSSAARGYFLLLLFSVLLIYLLQTLLGKAEQPPRPWTYRLLLIAISAMGLATVPSFLLALVPLWLWAVVEMQQQKQLRSQGLTLLLWPLGAAFGALVAYAPILYFNGYRVLFANEYVAPKSTGALLIALPQRAMGLFNYLTGLANTNWIMPEPNSTHSILGLSVLVLMVGLAAWALFQKRLAPEAQSAFRLAILLLCSFPVLALALRNPGYERTWIHLASAVWLLLACLLSLFSPQLERIPSFVMMLFITALGVAGGWNLLRLQNAQYHYAHPHYLADELVRTQAGSSKPTHIYVENHYHSMIAFYKLFRTGKTPKMQLTRLHEKPCNPVEYGSYDVLILQNDRPQNCLPPSDYQRVFQDSLYTLWQKTPVSSH